MCICNRYGDIYIDIYIEREGHGRRAAAAARAGSVWRHRYLLRCFATGTESVVEVVVVVAVIVVVVVRFSLSSGHGVGCVFICVCLILLQGARGRCADRLRPRHSLRRRRRSPRRRRRANYAWPQYRAPWRESVRRIDPRRPQEP